jgi:hypothetical protein
MTTAREHLNWCISRAMQYADNGDMTQAWASFGSDVRKHPGTAYIVTHELYGMEMLRQTMAGAGAEEFRHFISGWTARENAGAQPMAQ